MTTSADTIAAYRALPYFDLTNISIAVDMLNGTFEGDTAFTEPTYIVNCQPDIELADPDARMKELERIRDTKEPHLPAHHVPAADMKTRCVSYDPRAVSHDTKYDRGWLMAPYGLATSMAEIVEELRPYQRFGEVMFTVSFIGAYDDFKPHKWGGFIDGTYRDPLCHDGDKYYLFYHVTPRAENRDGALVLTGFTSEDHAIELETLLY